MLYKTDPSSTQPHIEISEAEPVQEFEDEPADALVRPPLFSSVTVRSLVALYLLWIEKELITGVLQGEIQGFAIVWFALIGCFLFAGIIWLLAPLVKGFFKKAALTDKQ